MNMYYKVDSSLFFKCVLFLFLFVFFLFFCFFRIAGSIAACMLLCVNYEVCL